MEKTVISIMLIVIITKIMGFSRDIFLAYFYGANGLTDAYLISTNISTVIFAFIGMGIAASYIPVYTKIFKERGREPAEKFTVNVTNTVMLLTTILVLMIICFTTPIVKLFAFGFEGETLRIAVIFTRIISVTLYFTALIFIFTSYLEVKNRFLITELSGLPLNIILIATIAISSWLGLYILAIGTVLAVIVQFLSMIPAIKKSGYRHRFVLDFKDQDLKRMIVLAIPVIIGVSADQINVLVDRTIASQITEGGISALTYAHRLVFFVQAIFVLAIVKVMFPKISKLAARKEIKELKDVVGKVIAAISIIVIPAAVGMMIFSRQITELMFGRGEFDEYEIEMTTGLIFFYALGLLGFGLREVLSKVFYSLEDSRTPMINAFGAMFLNVGLNLVLSRIIGLNGLALATSIAAIVSTVLLYASLVRKVGSLDSRRLMIDLSKGILAAIIMGVAARTAYSVSLLAVGDIAALFIGVCIGVVVYAAMLWVLQLSDIAYYKARVLALARR
ncbi:murein biosynthesis integral membrane protein MurJ [Planococcus maritimus]|uniref:murein biosynthesis integral membrane protein MurJ n=1 Tax=Planococcus maritimus TaxID=192421 RepID=UPI00080F0F6B|nr:murein biosynthesis integral membrane protein MurJ [Planococcus maritimus]ANU17809.1 murein biosynthesis integral membrane protein MurJ [Planococcus maritimus]